MLLFNLTMLMILVNLSYSVLMYTYLHHFIFNNCYLLHSVYISLEPHFQFALHRLGTIQSVFHSINADEVVVTRVILLLLQLHLVMCQ